MSCELPFSCFINLLGDFPVRFCTVPNDQGILLCNLFAWTKTTLSVSFYPNAHAMSCSKLFYNLEYRFEVINCVKNGDNIDQAIYLLCHLH